MITTGRVRRLAGLSAGTVAVVAVTVLGATGVLQGAEHSTIDQRFDVRGAEPAGELAVVAIDEKTFSSLDVTWPMRRNLHAQMIDRLREDGVRRIVYDVQFTEPSTRPDDDLDLLDAVERAPGTVLSTGESDAQGRTRVLGGDEQLAEIGAEAAGSTFPSDSGGVIRRYTAENTHLASMAAATAAGLSHPVTPADFAKNGDALIDFRGPAGTIPTYSFADVLEGRIDASELKGRIVVVGATAPVLQDIHPTAAAGPRLMPGPEIQANAIWTAMHGNPLRELPDWIGTLLALTLGLSGIALVLRFGPLRALIAVAAAAAAYVAIAIVAFDAGTVVPMAAPLLAMLAGATAAALVAIAGEIAMRAHLSRYSVELEREVSARTAELVETQLDVVLRLARAAELRDDDTGEHIDRMSEMCGEVALELGFTATEAKLLQHASALHDIGKIGVPDSILLKPGKLSDEEFDTMRTHVVQGAELLTGSTAPVMELAEIVARTHHEKWDGSGYPARIAGEAIPLPGRIAAVCDVFDALTHERPYKKAWTIADACAEIQRCAGSHFDPKVAAALMVVLEREYGDLIRQGPAVETSAAASPHAQQSLAA
ncbi:MAG: CHASE2 domain-containing protein [Solirubrobacteraceae bacterium]|nr:CHASE2 domain-containing protein [Solirubrobacteraceae bacterium]